MDRPSPKTPEKTTSPEDDLDRRSIDDAGDSTSTGRFGAPEKGVRATGELPGVSWGPGKNFYGWAMTILLIGVLAGIGFAGFRLFGETVSKSDSSATVEERRELERRVETLGADLCTAAMGAGEAPGPSTQIFGGKVHGPLHSLADALAEEDRPAAAKLLRDKFNVEEDIRRNVPPAELAVTFAALNESTMEALRILSLPSPPCPPPAEPPAAPAPVP